MVLNIMAMAMAAFVALGGTLVYGDGLIAANRTLQPRQMSMTTDTVLGTTIAATRRPITTMLTTVYGTEVVVVSTTGLPLSTITLVGPTPGPVSRGPIRGINKCEMGDHVTWRQWRIVSFDADIYNDPTKYCGSGYLANFRGECGIITNWGCGCTDGRPWPCSDIWMAFQTNMLCKRDQIRQAFHKASSGNIQMDC